MLALKLEDRIAMQGMHLQRPERARKQILPVAQDRAQPRETHFALLAPRTVREKIAVVFNPRL